MKLNIITIFLAFISLASCQEKLPEKTKQAIEKNKAFWQHRTNLINKNSMEYPIKKETTIGIEERTNRIYLQSAGCQFEVFVDDVLMFKLMGEITKSGAGITGDYDMNQLLLTSGKHEVKVRMYPMYGTPLFDGRGGEVDLNFSHFKNRDLRTVQYYEDMNGSSGILLNEKKEQWIDEKGEYGTDSYIEAHSAPKTPTPLKGKPVYEWRSTFEAQVPFDLIGWRNSVNLQKEQDDENQFIQSEVIAAYKKVYEIIKNRDVTGYLNLIKEREELITTALYYRENEKKKRSDMLSEVINNTDYEVEPMFEETFQLEFQGYGKLVTLLHKADGEGIIRLKNKKDSKDKITLDFRFQRKEKGGKLSVI